MSKISHPAKFNNSFMPMFAQELAQCKNVLDPFAGTGKIGAIKQFGYTGKIYANEIEREWLENNEFGCDVLSFEDAEYLSYPEEFFDGICTSPTYGNRMADHHNARDNSHRNTYTHCLGRRLTNGNTGEMQWGAKYREKHIKIYNHLVGLLKHGGMFILNIKNHIRQGEEIDVVSFHKETLTNAGMTMVREVFMPTPGLRYGSNASSRTSGEYILVFKKT